MKKKWAAVLAMGLLMTFMAGIAYAAILKTSGTTVFESAPFPPAADDTIFAFDEQQGVAFVATQHLDFGSISPGTIVNSHYIQYDPASPTGFVGLGSVTFDGPHYRGDSLFSEFVCGSGPGRNRYFRYLFWA